MTSPHPVRVGLLGCGRIGKMHADLLATQVDGIALAAVYDVVDAAAQEVATKHGVPILTPDEMFASSDIDAVAICSATDTHIDLLVGAAEAGKAVFIEKPLSLNLAEVDRGIAACDAAGIAVQVGFNRRFDPSHKGVRDSVLSGDVGDVHMCRITSRDPAPPPIAYIAVSGGIFNDMTIHDFDMARFVVGSEVTEVTAFAAVRVDPAIGEAGDYDTVVVTMRHENGALTTIDGSRQAVYGYDQRVEVFGSGGLALSDNPYSTTTVLRTAAGSRHDTIPYFFLDRYIPSYIAEWAAFVKVVRDGAPSPVTLADGRAPLVLGLAASRSVAEGRTVLVSEFD